MEADPVLGAFIVKADDKVTTSAVRTRVKVPGGKLFSPSGLFSSEVTMSARLRREFELKATDLQANDEAEVQMVAEPAAVAPMADLAERRGDLDPRIVTLDEPVETTFRHTLEETRVTSNEKVRLLVDIWAHTVTARVQVARAETDAQAEASFRRNPESENQRVVTAEVPKITDRAEESARPRLHAASVTCVEPVVGALNSSM